MLQTFIDLGGCRPLLKFLIGKYGRTPKTPTHCLVVWWLPPTTESRTEPTRRCRFE
jgi:hypothetical protein